MKIKLLLISAFLLPTIICCAQSNQPQPALSIANGGKVWASLYQQRAAEYKALCFQAYNMARWRLDEALKKRKGKKPLAVVTDIDETVLDNTPYDAARAINNREFDLKAWKTWTAKGLADTVPGAPSFFKYAAAKGVTVFYITNRDEDEREGTTKNLKRYSLPFADAEHIILRTGPSSKEDRRKAVLKDYSVVLICGDNLPDFDAAYDDKPPQPARDTATEKLRSYFGRQYIVIPNPTYGDFENAFFNNQKMSNAQKDSLIRAVIKLDK